MTKHAALPGFRDFYPEDYARRKQIFDAWREVARRFGFEEYDGPPLETLDLYIEKSGPEIVNQLFNFTDKGGREVALRPEMTPTLVRMLGARIKELPRPIRWYSTPQMFRYERQQRGRLREHFQLNMDIIGEKSILADADLLAAALEVHRILGLTSEDVVARVSDRRLLQHALVEIGVGEDDLPVAYNVIDKVERDPREVCLERLGKIGLAEAAAESALDLTKLGLQDFRSKYETHDEIQAVVAELEEYFEALDALGFGDWVTFDTKIVRGLAYYTGTVFEIFDRKGVLRAICGGGRYDNLFANLMGTDVPALGFGFGDVVLGELLKDRGLSAKYGREVDTCVIAVDPSVRKEALSIVSSLRKLGCRVIYPYRKVSVGRALKSAASSGAREAVIVGPNEIQKGEVVVKDLQKGSERNISLDLFLQSKEES